MNICFCLWRWRLFSQTIREGEIIHTTAREIAYVPIPDKDREEQERVKNHLQSIELDFAMLGITYSDTVPFSLCMEKQEDLLQLLKCNTANTMQQCNARPLAM